MKKKNLAYMIIAGTAALAVYVFTLCPTIYPGDSPEFITACYTLGIAHPPGYPLYCLTGKLFTLLPLGSIAWRVNLMSAVFGALAVVMLYALIRQVTGKKEIALFFSLAAAFSKIFWSQAVMAEVYTLNAFFVLLCIYLMLKWSASADSRYLYLGFFLTGLGLCNHYILALSVPGCVLFWIIEAAAKKRRVENPVSNGSFILKAAGFFLLGLCVYGYLVIRSTANPPLDWGNPETIKGFLKHVLRVQYRAFETSAKIGLNEKLLFTGDFIYKCLTQLPPFLWALSIPGIAWLFRKKQSLLILAGTVIVLNGFITVIMLQFHFNPLYRGVVEVYYLPAYLVFAFLCACGFHGMRLFLKNRKNRITAAKILVIVPAAALVLNFHENDLRKNYFIYDFAGNILKNLEQGSFLYLPNDDGVVFPMLYLKYVEKIRPDIGLKDPYGLLFNDAAQTASSAVYSSDLLDFNPGRKNMGFVYEHAGGEAEAGTDLSWYESYEKRGIDDEGLFKDFWTRGIVARYPFVLGYCYFKAGLSEKGAQEFEKALKIAHDIPWILQNIGYFCAKEGYNEMALRAYGKLSQVDRFDPAGYRGLINCYRQLNDTGKMIEGYEKLLKIEPDKAGLHSIIASLYDGKGLADKAVEHYKKALREKPDFVDVWNNLGIIYQKKNNLEESVKYFNKAVELDGNYVNAHYNLAIGYIRSDVKKAMEEFRRVISINPAFPGVHYNLGVLMDKEGDTAGAIAEYTEELKLNPDYSSACKNLGLALYKTGGLKKAVYYWKKYLELEPGAADAGVINNELRKMNER